MSASLALLNYVVPLMSLSGGVLPKVLTIAVVVICGAFSIWVFGHNRRR